MPIRYNHPQARKKSNELLKKYLTCWCCGSTKRISVHHDDRDRKNNTDANVFVICAVCHGRIHAKDKLLGKGRSKANLSLFTAEQWEKLTIKPPGNSAS